MCSTYNHLVCNAYISPPVPLSLQGRLLSLPVSFDMKANSSVNSIVFMEEWVVVNDLTIKLKENIRRMKKSEILFSIHYALFPK